MMSIPGGVVTYINGGSKTLDFSDGEISCGTIVLSNANGIVFQKPNYLHTIMSATVGTTDDTPTVLVTFDMGGATFGANTYELVGHIVMSGATGANGCFDITYRGAVPVSGAASVSLVEYTSTLDAGFIGATYAISETATPGSLTILVTGTADPIQWSGNFTVIQTKNA